MRLDSNSLSKSCWSVIWCTDFHLHNVHSIIVTGHENPRVGDAIRIEVQSIREDDFSCPVVIVTCCTRSREHKVACIEVFLYFNLKDMAVWIQSIRCIRSRGYHRLLIGDVEHDVVRRADGNKDAELENVVCSFLDRLDRFTC